MKSHIKIGLIVGIIGLFLNILVSLAIGICGPFTALIAGAVAGFITGRQEKGISKGDGARLGAISGGIVGALVLVGQMIGGFLTLSLFQVGEVPLPFGAVPPTSADSSLQLIYYLSGLGVSLCFGLVGLALSALAGAGTGYLSTPEQKESPITF